MTLKLEWLGQSAQVFDLLGPPSREDHWRQDRLVHRRGRHRPNCPPCSSPTITSWPISDTSPVAAHITGYSEIMTIACSTPFAWDAATNTRQTAAILPRQTAAILPRPLPPPVARHRLRYWGSPRGSPQASICSRTAPGRNSSTSPSRPRRDVSTGRPTSTGQNIQRFRTQRVGRTRSALTFTDEGRTVSWVRRQGGRRCDEGHRVAPARARQGPGGSQLADPVVDPRYLGRRPHDGAHVEQAARRCGRRRGAGRTKVVLDGENYSPQSAQARDLVKGWEVPLGKTALTAPSLIPLRLRLGDPTALLEMVLQITLKWSPSDASDKREVVRSRLSDARRRLLRPAWRKCPQEDGDDRTLVAVGVERGRAMVRPTVGRQRRDAGLLGAPRVVARSAGARPQGGLKCLGRRHALADGSVECGEALDSLSRKESAI